MRVRRSRDFRWSARRQLIAYQCDICNHSRYSYSACEEASPSNRAAILHRDVKPSNLMLDQSGNLWITDFGLARIEGDSGLTMSGDLLGTLRYMSPIRKRPLST